MTSFLCGSILLFILIINSASCIRRQREELVDLKIHTRVVRSSNLKVLGDTLLEILPTLRSPISGELLVKDLQGYSERNISQLVCNSKRCLGCLQAITMGFDSNLMNLMFIRDVWALRDQLFLNSIDYRHFCEWYDKKINDTCITAYDEELGKVSLLDDLMEQEEKKIPCPLPVATDWRPKSIPISGRFVKMECFKRGSIYGNANDGLIRLCDVCWGVRILDINHSPSIFHEIVCETPEDAYMGGHGKCFQTYTGVMTTWKRTWKQEEWQEKHVIIGSGCMFALNENSLLLSLVGQVSKEPVSTPSTA